MNINGFNKLFQKTNHIVPDQFQLHYHYQLSDNNQLSPNKSTIIINRNKTKANKHIQKLHIVFEWISHVFSLFSSLSLSRILRTHISVCVIPAKWCDKINWRIFHFLAQNFLYNYFESIKPMQFYISCNTHAQLSLSLSLYLHLLPIFVRVCKVLSRIQATDEQTWRNLAEMRTKTPKNITELSCITARVMLMLIGRTSISPPTWWES